MQLRTRDSGFSYPWHTIYLVAVQQVTTQYRNVSCFFVYLCFTLMSLLNFFTYFEIKHTNMRDSSPDRQACVLE